MPGRGPSPDRVAGDAARTIGGHGDYEHASGDRPAAWWRPAFAGFRGVSWQTVALILAINTGYAAILWIEDHRTFWHPFITAQCFGLAIAYMVNAARPWEQAHPLWRLIAGGSRSGPLLGFAVMILIKDYPCCTMYSWSELSTRTSQFAWTALRRLHQRRSCQPLLSAQIPRGAGAARKSSRARPIAIALSRQAIEAQLKLMQAQVEPHFLFNTLASVQFLTETDPPESRADARPPARLPARRAAASCARAARPWAREIELARAYLSIMQMRMGSALTFSVDVPESCVRTTFHRCC